MKKTISVIAFILAAFMICAAFAGCSSGSKSASRDYDAPAEAAAVYDEPMEEPAYEDGDPGEGGASLGGLDNAKYVENDRKLIYTSVYTIETKKFVESYNKIVKALDAAGGFISNEETTGAEPEVYGDSGRRAYLVMRIPIASYDKFLESIEGVGSVLSKTRSTQDVTTDYYDNEARIELYQAHYDKLMGYLQNATDMSDIIAIESEMNDVLYTIDQLKGNKRYMDDRIEYSTVEVNLREVVEYTEVVTSKETLGERISQAFNSVIKWLGQFFEGFAVVFIAALPILAILFAIFSVIFFPVRAARKKKMKKLAAAAAQKEETAAIAEEEAPAEEKEQE